MAVKIFVGKNTDLNAPYDPADYEVTWEGLVLGLGEHNGYDDSDFYAIVWDAETDGPKEVGYATTRGWTYKNSATVDAPPELVAKYAAWQAKVRKERIEAAAAAELAEVKVGRTVEVVKGRKVPVGFAGVVIWSGTSYGRQRIGIKSATGEVQWTAADNVKVTWEQE